MGVAFQGSCLDHDWPALPGSDSLWPPQIKVRPCSAAEKVQFITAHVAGKWHRTAQELEPSQGSFPTA